MLLKKFSNDALRFAAAASKLGQDAPFQEKEVKTGAGVVNKVYNAVKFGSMLLSNFSIGDKEFDIDSLNGVDIAIISKMQGVAKEAQEAFEAYEYSKAKALWTEFFMSDICDNYLEIVKQRLWKPEEFGEEESKKAQKAYYYVLYNAIKGLAPIMPFITEVVYQKFFSVFEEEESIHVASYPKFDGSLVRTDLEENYELFTSIVADVRKAKAEKQLSLKDSLEEIKIRGTQEQIAFIENNLQDLKNVTNTENIVFGDSEEFKVELK